MVKLPAKPFISFTPTGRQPVDTVSAFLKPDMVTFILASCPTLKRFMQLSSVPCIKFMNIVPYGELFPLQDVSGNWGHPEGIAGCDVWQTFAIEESQLTGKRMRFSQCPVRCVPTLPRLKGGRVPGALGPPTHS